jgi:hypothetical protein
VADSGESSSEPRPEGGSEERTTKDLEKIKADDEKFHKHEIKDFKEPKQEKIEKNEQKEFKNEAKELKIEKLEKREWKELKHEKVEKEKRDKDERKELKNEKYEIKEKDNKLERKDIKSEKPEFEKPTREVGEIPDPTTLPIDRDSLMQHADALEQAARQLRHFIETSERPDLSQGALKKEPDQGGGE